ncbi:MAG: stage V sporulation protein AD [Oscillospiraceae bacterium]|jgi:stage V sporulation protein AD|nr:stage V sporulation protein AD [Oscillospiraceae bacterium]
MSKRIGADTIELTSRPRIAAWSASAGQKEREGPLGGAIDYVIEDDLLGQKTWELAEAAMLRDTALRCLGKASMKTSDIDFLLGGDLINQIMAVNLCARELEIPLLGLYGACSTMCEALAVGGIMADGGAARRVLCAASSHFSTAERQYRTPLEQGGQRPASAQWTVTGAGATLLCGSDYTPEGVIPAASLTHATIGRVIDYGVKDMANMGAVMAPAAADTLARHLRDTGRGADYYDEIITGDLGKTGRGLMLALLDEKGVKVDATRVWDCGERIFSPEQDAHSGGSGCGCSAVVLNSYILGRFARNELNRVALMATGALLNATSVLQGETIPGVAHLVVIEKEDAR